MSDQPYLTTDELKANADLTMAGFDDLPASVRRALRECLQYVPDTELAAALYRSGRATEAKLLEMISSAELAAHRDGVADGIACPTEAGFRVVRRRSL